MPKALELLILRSLVESNIYDLSILSSIYYYSLFNNYCEIEVRDLSDYNYNIDSWTPRLITSYVSDNLSSTNNYPTSLNLEISSLMKEQIFSPRVNSKRSLIQESLAIFTLNEVPYGDNQQYWKNTKYGKISGCHTLSGGVELIFVPKMSVIELINIKTDYNNLVGVK